MNREEAIEKIINGFCKLRVWCELYPDDCQKEDCEMWWAIESLKAKMDGDMGEVSDGYHTFNQLYHQRAVLFATIVKQNKEKAWKSWKHGDGKFCFDSNKEWFIVGVDTPKGSYTYHYEKKYWDMFDCIELEHGKFWDGHTEDDVTRLLSLPSADRQTTDCTEFMEWIKAEVLDENNWELNAVAYGEIICRKLKKLGWIDVEDGCYVDTRPTGEWVLKESEDGVYWWHECSECGEKPLLDRWMHDEKLSDFCWNCGSKMFKGGEEE